MANAKLSVEIGAKSAELSKGLAKAKGEFTKFSKDTKKTVNDMSSVFSEMGSAVGGVVDSIASSLTSLATAGGPIALVIAAIGVMAKAIMTAKENMKLFSETADKLKYGFAGYSQDAADARTQTRKRATGGKLKGQEDRAVGSRIYNNNLLTAQQREIGRLQMESGKQMEKDSKLLYAQVTGLKDKVQWEQTYNKLLQDQETLADSRLAKAVEFEALEAELTKQKLIILDKESNKAQKDEAVNRASEISLEISKGKTEELDKQIDNINKMAALTATQEVVEDQVLQLQKDKETVQKEYNLDKLKTLKLESNSLKTEAARLKILEEQEKRVKAQALALEKLKDTNTKIAEQIAKSAQTEMPESFAGMLKPKTKLIGGGLARGGNDLAGLTNPVEQTTESLQKQYEIIGGIENAFLNMFSSIEEGFDGVAQAFGNMLKDMAIRMAAKAALFGVLSIISGGLFGISKIAVAAAGIKNAMSFFANGTSYAPGGLSLVGERGPELVNLPKGSQVFTNKQTQNMMGANTIILNPELRLSGKDLQLVLNRI